MESPMGLGRRGERVAKTPCGRLSRKGTTSRRATSHLVQMGQQDEMGECCQVLQPGFPLRVQLDGTRDAGGGNGLDRHAHRRRERRVNDADRRVGNGIHSSPLVPPAGDFASCYYLPRITSVDLMITVTVSPTCRLSRSTELRVMADTTV